MKNFKSLTLIALAILVLVTTAFTYSSAQAADDAGRRGPNGNRGQGGNVQGSVVATTSLTDVEIECLVTAIQEEYTAMNTYLAVVEKLGDVSPFVLIARSEQQHVNALIRTAERYGVEAPANAGEVADIEWSTYTEACELGVTFEKLDAALYDELLQNTSNSALARVYTNLQSASLNKHLPAFESCAQ
jgi:hypothetical protein